MKKPSFIFIIPPDLDDADSIKQLMDEYARKGIILERTLDDIRNSIDSFLVAKHKNRVIGVIARFDYGQKLVEIRSLVVDKKYSGQNIGTVLLKAMVTAIKQAGDYKIFALSYTPEFFLKNEFIEVPKGSLPEKIWKDCISCPDKENCGETALSYSESRIISR